MNGSKKPTLGLKFYFIFLKTELDIARVELEALVDGRGLCHAGGGASSRAAVEAAVVGDNVVLDEALGDVSVDAVAEEQVRATGEVTRDVVLAGGSEELGLEGGGVLAEACNVLGHEDGHDTSGVGAGHRGTREEVDDVVAGGPGAEDLLAGGVDVDATTVVGEAGDFVLDVDGADGYDVGVCAAEMGGCATAGVLSVVSSGNGDVNASLGGTGNDFVDGVGKALETP